MPLYEYICDECLKHFSEVMSAKEHATRKIRCPKCNSEQVARLVEPPEATTSKQAGSSAR